MTAVFMAFIWAIVQFAMGFLMGDSRRALLTTRKVFGPMLELQQQWLVELGEALERGDTAQAMELAARLRAGTAMYEAAWEGHMANDSKPVRWLRDRAYDRMNKKRALESLGVK